MKTKEDLLKQAGITLEQITPKWQSRIKRKEEEILKIQRAITMTKSNDSFKKEKKEELLKKYNEQINGLKEEIEDDVISAIAEYQVDAEAAAKKAQQEADKKQLEENYSALITQADIFLLEEKYEDAHKLYNDALVLKPNEEHPTAKIAEIDKIMAEKKAIEDKANADRLAAEEKENKRLEYKRKPYGFL